MNLDQIKELIKKNEYRLKENASHNNHLKNKEYKNAYYNIISKILDMDEIEKEKHDILYNMTIKELGDKYINFDDLNIFISSRVPIYDIIIVYVYEDYKNYRKKIPYSLNGIPIQIRKTNRIKPLFLNC
jgi:hypothetical protein